MITISSQCDQCGVIELDATIVTLLVNDDPALCRFTFRCPTCDVQVTRHADGAAQCKLIVHARVRPTPWSPPVEPRPVVVEPLTAGEVDEWAAILEHLEHVTVWAKLP